MTYREKCPSHFYSSVFLQVTNELLVFPSMEENKESLNGAWPFFINHNSFNRYLIKSFMKRLFQLYI